VSPAHLTSLLLQSKHQQWCSGLTRLVGVSSQGSPAGALLLGGGGPKRAASAAPTVAFAGAQTTSNAHWGLPITHTASAFSPRAAVEGSFAGARTTELAQWGPNTGNSKPPAPHQPPPPKPPTAKYVPPNRKAAAAAAAGGGGGGGAGEAWAEAEGWWAATYPAAAAVAVRLEHAAGCELDELSDSQLDALEVFHRRQLAWVWSHRKVICFMRIGRIWVRRGMGSRSRLPSPSTRTWVVLCRPSRTLTLRRVCTGRWRSIVRSWLYSVTRRLALKPYEFNARGCPRRRVKAESLHPL
jgi:hypothetical protein